MPKEWFSHFNIKSRFIWLNNVMYDIQYDLDTKKLSLYHWEFFNDEHEIADHKPLVTIPLTAIPLVNDAIKLLANAFAEQMHLLAEENDNA